jgi:hypothetical protein
MRRFVILLVVALAVVVAAPAASAQLPGRDLEGAQTVLLCDGVGVADLRARGSVLGQLARGRVRIRNLPDSVGTEINVYGAEWRRSIDENTTVYGGWGLRFRALGGAWRVRIRGRAIDASAVGRGALRLWGTAGTFAIDRDECNRAWPEEATTFRYGV